MGTYTLVDFKPINAHADFIIAHTAQPRVVLEESKAWCESVGVFLGQVKFATRPEDRKVCADSSCSMLELRLRKWLDMASFSS
jgi:hypothetical protein